MRISDGFGIALTAFFANKMRTALTMLGLIIGVSAVIAMLAIGRGAEEQVSAQFAGLGADILYVRSGTQSQGGVQGAAGTAATLTLDDAQAIAQGASTIAAVAPESTVNAQVLSEGQNLNTRIVGTTPDFQTVQNFQLADGEFFNAQDVTSATPLIVLGANVAQNLFGDSSPVGQTVRVSASGASIPFRVAGVMQPKGGTGFLNQDDQAFIPITTLQRKLQTQRTTQGGVRVNQIDVQVASPTLKAAAMNEITDILLQRHRVAQPDFTIQNPQDIVQQRESAQAVLSLLLAMVASIALLVGGIGIMNIMLVSVTERTHEIGIRKAVGARRSDIMLQFMVESVTVSVVGGAIGVALGVAAAALVDGKRMGTQTLATSVSVDSIVLAFVVAAAIGIFFGLYPASRAARLNPIQALRYE